VLSRIKTQLDSASARNGEFNSRINNLQSEVNQLKAENYHLVMNNQPVPPEILSQIASKSKELSGLKSSLRATKTDHIGGSVSTQENNLKRAIDKNKELISKYEKILNG
jgi:predicted  nucleic acid-binding Zn-ribbon protein